MKTIFVARVKGKKNISTSVSKGKVLSICLMACCLTFLTSINYFLYPSDMESSSVSISGKSDGKTQNNFPPSGPTEEKSSGQGFTILEEFLHEAHPLFNFEGGNRRLSYQVAAASRILYFHGELISPPPEL